VSALKRTGPPKRKKRINFRSQKVKAKDAERDEVRARVILRDGGCVYHRMTGAQGIEEPCGALSYGSLDDIKGNVQVHEMVTRGRGGSILDPDNCVALCPPAHSWVTAHPRGAEALGLMLPSWANVMMVEGAQWRRHELQQSRASYSTPWWRADEPDFEPAAKRDLREVGWNVDG
jgi:hypothetical protein